MSFKSKIITITPMLCLIIYLFIGFVFDIWHPTWVIFFAILIVPALFSNTASKVVCATWPLICIVAYILLGVFANLWHPGWLVFLTIPIVETLFQGVTFGKKKTKRVEIIEEKN